MTTIERWLIYGFLIACMVSILACNAHAGTINERQAVLAVLGEESHYDAQVAIAACIRHRGSLKGVYGGHSKRILAGKYTRAEYAQAKRAWDESVVFIGQLADGWGNAADVRKWSRQVWFKRCEVIYKLGDTYFWRQVR